MLGIITPVIEEEFVNYERNLRKVLHRLYLSNIESYKIIVVLQSKNTIKLPKIENVEFLTTNFYSVSNARNLGLIQKKYKFNYIYFLDQDALPSLEFLNITSKNMEQNYNVWLGKIDWVDDTKSLKEQCIQEDKLSTFFLPYNTFLGCYIFKYELIKKNNIFFNENLGPAENTYLKAGEDALFISEFFSKNKINWSTYYPRVYIEHPIREPDNYKTLLYLEGQAAVYKFMVRSNDTSNIIRLSAFVYLILYLMNGLFKFIKREPSAKKILIKRFKSIWKKYDLFKKEA